MNQAFEITELTVITHKKLEEYSLINKNEKIQLVPNYKIVLNNKTYSHYIINCISSNKKYFLKVFKDRDNIFQCNEYIKNFIDEFGNQKFSTILVPRFYFNEVYYYITSFVEGESINNIGEQLTKQQCQKIGNDIRKLWFELTEINTLYYSEKGEFFNEDAATIFKRKLKFRLTHPVFKHISNSELYKAYCKCCEIIETCEFSKPSLIHMDVKPANIVYNSKNDLVTLIDFEHARFGDIDFGWVQILLSGYNSVGEIYEQKIYPYIINDNLNLSDALKIPKLKCYIFYQTACNLIYYYKNNNECPYKMKECFYSLLNEFVKE